MQKTSTRHRLEHLAVDAVARAICGVPARVAHVTGGALGLTFFALDRSHRRQALANLEAAFPTRSAAERRRIARRVFGHFGRLLVDLLRFARRSPAQMLEIVEFEGGDRVRQAHAQGRGVLFFTGHFGFWEIHAIAHALEFGPIGVLARALDNPPLNAMLERIRTATGNSVIYRQGAVRRVLRTLAANQGVAILIDQHIHGADVVHVDFFNRPAATTSALAAMALRTGAPLIPVFALPLPGGRYRLIYEHAVPVPDGEPVDALQTLTQRCTDVLEMYVRRYPELWLWMHRRWRDLPAGTRPPRGMFPVGSRHEPPLPTEE